MTVSWECPIYSRFKGQVWKANYIINRIEQKNEYIKTFKYLWVIVLKEEEVNKKKRKNLLPPKKIFILKRWNNGRERDDDDYS